MPVSTPLVTKSEYWADSDINLMARLQDPRTFADLEQADISAITYEVWNKQTPRLKSSGTLTTSSVIYDTLQTGNGWDSENYPDGFNFLWTMPASLFPNDDQEYRVKIKVTCGGRKVYLIHDHRTKPWN